MIVGRSKETRKQRRLLAPSAVLAVLALPFFGPHARAAHPESPRKVVVLFPHNDDGSPGNSLVDQSIRSTVANSPAGPVEIYDEYLDVSHPRDLSQWQLQVDFLRQKYAQRKID